MTAVFAPVLQGLSILCEILAMLIFVNTLLSWISPMGRLRDFTSTFCEPLLAPFRALMNRLMPSGMPLDFSPTIAMLVLFALASLFSGAAGGI